MLPFFCPSEGSRICLCGYHGSVPDADAAQDYAVPVVSSYPIFPPSVCDPVLLLWLDPGRVVPPTG
jgi:hypothetical protein